jgi:hypothetical protein
MLIARDEHGAVPYSNCLPQKKRATAHNSGSRRRISMANFIHTDRYGYGKINRYSVMKSPYNEIANVRGLKLAESIASHEFKYHGDCYIVDNEENKIVFRYEK